MSVQEAKTKEELWRAVFKEAVEALRKNAKTKAEIIKRTCTLLEEKGMPLEMICGRVMKELGDFASRKYFFEVIEKKYKDAQKIREYHHKTETKAVEEEPPIEQKIQTEQKQEDPIIWQINVQDYRIEDVDSYDKTFLRKLVVYLHNRLTALAAAAQQ